MNSITESLAAAGAKDIEQYAERGSLQPRYRPLPRLSPVWSCPSAVPMPSARPLAGIIRPGVDIKIPYEWS